MTSGIVVSLRVTNSHVGEPSQVKSLPADRCRRALSHHSNIMPYLTARKTHRNFSRDSRRSAWVMLPCSSAAAGSPSRPKRTLVR